MKIRLGYVAMSLYLESASPSQTISLKNLLKINNYASKLLRLRKIVSGNLRNTYRILLHNESHNIQVYRFTSKLVPLATHPELADWNYLEEFSEDFKKIGDFVKEHNFRVSAHPDHFTLINSPQSHVNDASIKDLQYHVGLFQAMGLNERYKLVIHVGGRYNDKDKALLRFRDNFLKLPEEIRYRIILENDDKSYTVRDVLSLCEELHIPMVLDVHHHECNNNGEQLEEYLPRIFHTWDGQIDPPKIHFSSPKSPKQFRHHADDIDPDHFIRFLEMVRNSGQNLDVMLEAKNKDAALFHLMDELRKRPLPFVTSLNEASIDIS